MAWFYYGDIKRNGHKKGVCLRVGCLLEDAAIKDILDGRYPRWVEVEEVFPKKGQVLLKLWCPNTKVERDAVRTYERDKGKPVILMTEYTVVEILAKENPKWVCESDIGRGYVPGKRRR